MKTVVGVLFVLVVAVVVGLVWALATLTGRTTHAQNERVQHMPTEPIQVQVQVQVPIVEPPAPEPVQEAPREQDFAGFWTDLYDYGAACGVVFTLAETKALYRVAHGQRDVVEQREEGQL